MLYFVLFLVAAALAGVVAALITANSLWAWISIGLSVLAGLVLLVDWIRRRPGGTSAAATTSAGAEPSTRESPDDESSVAESAEAAPAEAEHDESPDAETTAGSAVDSDGQPSEQGSTTETQPAVVGTPGETEQPATESTATTVQDVPGEEQTDAADALIISDLDAEVLVVDEYPRYHLDACGWLTGRETIPIAVSEARDLGFGPCARCEPDSALATKHRKTRKRFRTRAES